MSDTRDLEYDTMPSDAARRIDALCDRYEEAWLAGQAPRIEDYLGDLPDPQRSALRAELLLLEQVYRQPNVGDTAVTRTASQNLSTATPPRLRGKPADLPAFIGKYRVVQRLGAGGQGEVYRAVHPTLGQDVVIKWVRQDLSADAHRRLIDEGRVLARLDDPGVVRIHDVDVHEGRPFAVFAYVAGQSLGEHLRQRQFSFRAAAALTADLAAILERVHRQGILHRDLKPANVLLDAAGRPRLLDFGLASLRGPYGAINPPEQDDVCGSYPYMAPEQARGEAERVGPRTEVFGLGAILYQLLTRQAPYRGRTAAEVHEQAVLGRVTPPRQIDPRIPRALERLCLKALAADPEQRYASAGEMRRALRGYLRRPLLLAGAAVLVLGAILALLLPSWWSARPSPVVEREEPVAVHSPLTGELHVRVWSPRGEHWKEGLEIGKDFAALPVHNKERLRIEVSLSEPAHAFLVWLDSEGGVTPLYPWNEGRIRQRRLVVAPPRPATKQIHSPADRPDKSTGGWVMSGKSGLETILLLARREPLPAEVKLAQLIGKAPVTRLRDPLEFAIRGGDEGQQIGSVNRGQHRGPEAEVEEIDDPLLQLLGRLREHFEVIRAVRFAHQGSS